MAFDMLNIAIVGDEFVSRGIHLKSSSNFRNIQYVDYICERFLEISEIIKITDKYLEDKHDVDLVMLFPFLWDIIFMNFDQEIQAETIHMKENDITISEFVSLISYATKRWQHSFPQVTIFWCLPYTPDFYRFNKISDFWVEQDVGRSFYEIIRKLGCELFENVPGIHLVDLHECYFLRNVIYEKSFYPNVREQLRHVHTCTADGLHPTEEFISNFATVFDRKIFPVVMELKRKCTSNVLGYSSVGSISESSTYNVGKIGPMKVFDYALISEKRGNIGSLQNESDQPLGSDNSTFKNNILFESSSNNSRRLSSESFDSDFKRSIQELDNSLQVYKGNYKKVSNTSHGFNENNNENVQNRYIPDVKESSLTTKANVPSRSITEELYSLLNADSNISSSSAKECNPQNILRKSSEGPSRPVDQLEVPSKVSQNVSNDIIKNIPEISLNILNSLKDALSFLNTNKIEENVKEPTDIISFDESKVSTYYGPYLKNFFNPLAWKDLFLCGDEDVAVDCMKICVDSLNKISFKKGVTVVMVTSSVDLVKSCQSALLPLIESNKIGFNDEIAFCAPLVLVDSPTNIKLRLNQIKKQGLGDLSALIIFGDEFLDLYSLNYVDFSSLVKHLLTSSRGNVDKVVISQSGSPDKEVSAQSIFNVTFLSPKRIIDKKKEVEKLNKSVGLTDFLMSSSADLEGTCSSIQQSDLALTKQKPEPLISSSKEKHSDRSRSSTSRHKSPPVLKEKSSHSTISSSESHKTSKPTVKLEDLFALARIPIPKEKKRENDAYNKEFMKKLEEMPKSVQKAYMMEGKEVLHEHECIYKTYKDVPDLHPVYEEKYELFIKMFEQAYGKEYNPKHLQTAWKRFWSITVSCIKDSEWLDRKMELQRDFMIKHGMIKEVEVKSKETECLEAKIGITEAVKRKLEDDEMMNKKNEAKKMLSTKESEKPSKETKKIEENKNTKVNYDDDKRKKSLESDVKNAKYFTEESKNNESNITKLDNEDDSEIIVIDDDDDAESNKCNKEETENNENKIKIDKEKEETSNTDSKSCEGIKEKAVVENNLKKRSISPAPIAESKKKLKEGEDELLKSKPVRTEELKAADNTKSGVDSLPSKAEPDKKNSEFVKNSNDSSHLKSVIEMRRKLIIDADEEDKYNPVKIDKKDEDVKIEKDNVKCQVKSKPKENPSTEKDREESLPIKRKIMLPKAYKESTIEDSLKIMIEKEVDKLLKKGSSLSGNDGKTSKLKKDVTQSSTRRETKYDVSDNHRKKSVSERSDSFRNKSSNEKDYIRSKMPDTRTNIKKDSEALSFSKKPDTEGRKLLFDLENYKIGDKPSGKEVSLTSKLASLSSKLEKSKPIEYKEQRKYSDKRSSPSTNSSRTARNPLLSDLTQFRTEITTPFSKKETSITDFLIENSSSQKPLFPISMPPKNAPERKFSKQITNTVETEEEEDFKSLYINTCSELASKKPAATNKNNNTTLRDVIAIDKEDDDDDDDDSDFLIRTPASPKSFSKSKIIFNLGKPKIKFSLYEALNALESVCPIIGVMGAALKSIVQSARALLPNFYEAYKLFAEPDSELLVNIAINKLKSFSYLTPKDKESYQKTIALSEKLLEEAKKSMQKGPPPSSSRSSSTTPLFKSSPAPVKNRISVEAVAKATVGLSTSETYQFIKNAYVYKGLTEPSKAEVEQIFKEVSKLHFEYALKT